MNEMIIWLLNQPLFLLYLDFIIIFYYETAKGIKPIGAFFGL